MRADVWVFPGELCSIQGLEVLEPGGETGEHSRAGLELLDPSLSPGTASIINVPTAFHRWFLGRQRQGSGTCDVMCIWLPLVPEAGTFSIALARLSPVAWLPVGASSLSSPPHHTYTNHKRWP